MATEVIGEYYLPDSVKEAGIISVVSVVQGYRYSNLLDKQDNRYGESDRCNINCSQGKWLAK
jgi:hypothetical protein